MAAEAEAVCLGKEVWECLAGDRTGACEEAECLEEEGVAEALAAGEGVVEAMAAGVVVAVVGMAVAELGAVGGMARP